MSGPIHFMDADRMNFTPVSAANPLPVTSGGDGIVTQSAAIGTVSDAAWDGVAADATVISLLKAIALNTAA